MQWSFLCLGILLPVIQSIHMNNDFELAHAEPVLDFRIVGHNEGPNAIEHGHHQPHADEIQVTFHAFGKDWDFELFVDHHMFSEKTVFSFYGKDDDGNDDIYHMKPHHTLYKTKPDAVPRGTFNIYDDQTVHAMIGTIEGAYVIDPASHFPEFNISTTMAMYHDDDLHHEILDKLPKFTRSLLQINQGTFTDANPRAYTGSADLQQNDAGAPTKWVNCYTGDAVGEKKFGMGMAITFQYYEQVASAGATGTAAKTTAAQNHIKNLLADSNTIYAPQMGVHLYVEVAHIRTAAGVGAIGGVTAPWNLAQPAQARNGGCVDPTTNVAESASITLGKLRTWRQNVQPNNAGLWHLMTTCFPAPGTVGIAYLNAICTNRVGSGLSSSLSATRPGSRAIWKVVAHEIGHNFGGGHSFELGQGTTGGIMDYGDGLLNGVYQFNSQFRKVPMCQLINTRMAQPQTTVCFANYPASNGKTYVWVDGTPSACPVTCAVTGQAVPQVTTPKVCKESPGTGAAVVADDLCPPPKPNPTTSACVGLPACLANVCGDGRIGGTEQCDSLPFDTACCNPAGSGAGIECTTKTTANCVVNMDACFVSIKSLKTYCFRGNSYNRYSPGVATRDETYPRNIAQYWTGLPAGFDSDIDAVIQRKEGRIYLIKGMQYAVYEFGFGVHNQGIAQNAATFLSLPTTWTKVDAAVSLNSGQGGAYLFNAAAKEYCRFNFAPGGDLCSGTVRPLNDWNGGDAFPLAGVTAARRYWPEIGIATPALNLAVDLMHNGKYVRYTFGQGLNVQVQTSQAFGAASTTPQPVAQQCSSGCFDCSGNNAICQICEQDYQLVSGNCYPIEYVIEMLFNTLTFVSDKQYVMSTTVTDSLWNSHPGNTGNAVTLTGTDNILLDTSKFPTNMEDWEFHFWVNIDSDPGVTINLVAGSLMHAGVPYHFSFYLAQKMSPSFLPVANIWIPTYKLVKNPLTNPTVLTLASDFEIAIRTWVHLIASLKQGNMELTIDGGTLSIPYDDAQSQTNTQIASWEFLSFEIGKTTIPSASTYSGITGYMDQFHVDLLKPVTFTGSMAVLRPVNILYFVAALALTLY